MGINAESIVAMSAILQIDSEVAEMSKEQYRNELMYQATMNLARKMLSEGIITEKEYCQIDTMFQEKYRPVFGTLFSDISLTLR